MTDEKEFAMSARRGATLVEVLVVIGIIAVLIGITLPAIQRVRESADRATSENNLRQIAVAAQNYAAQHNSLLPQLALPDGSRYLFGELLPYLEAAPQAERIKVFRSPADPTLNAPAVGAAIAPGGPDPRCSYVANAQVLRFEKPASL